jgi:hypothetical protein
MQMMNLEPTILESLKPTPEPVAGTVTTTNPNGVHCCAVIATALQISIPVSAVTLTPAEGFRRRAHY